MTNNILNYVILPFFGTIILLLFVVTIYYLFFNNSETENASIRKFFKLLIELFEKYRKIFLDDSTSLHHYLKFVIKTIAFIFVIVLHLLLFFNINDTIVSHGLTAAYVTVFVVYFILELVPLIKHLTNIFTSENLFLKKNDGKFMIDFIISFVSLYSLIALILVIQNRSALFYLLLSALLIIVIYFLFKFSKIFSIILTTILTYSSFLMYTILFFFILNSVSITEQRIYYTLIVCIFILITLLATPNKLIAENKNGVLIYKKALICIFLFFSFFIAITILVGIIFHNDLKHLFFDINDENDKQEFKKFLTSSKPKLVISNKIKNSELFDSWFFLNKEKNQAIYSKIIGIILLILLFTFNDEIINYFSVFISLAFKKTLLTNFSKNGDLYSNIRTMYINHYNIETYKQAIIF